MSTKNPILAAKSKEIQKDLPLDKIKLLEDELNQLTILENPIEIQKICNSIIEIKKTLEKKHSSSEEHV